MENETTAPVAILEALQESQVDRRLPNQDGVAPKRGWDLLWKCPDLASCNLDMHFDRGDRAGDQGVVVTVFIPPDYFKKFKTNFEMIEPSTEVQALFEKYMKQYYIQEEKKLTRIMVDEFFECEGAYDCFFPPEEPEIK